VVDGLGRLSSHALSGEVTVDEARGSQEALMTPMPWPLWRR
jgi:hypothetical protein